MTDVAIIERDMVVPGESRAGSPLSWSAAIAGAFAATAVTFLIVALGSGIGLSFASPYSGPSAKAMTIAAAVWLLMAETMGFATGGYLAGRLRSPAYDGVIGETTFRDAAQGFIVWALGTVIMGAVLIALGYFAASATARVAAGAATAAGQGGTATASPATDYFVSLLFRPGPAPATNNAASATVGAAAAGAQPALNAETRAEATRVLVRSIAQGKLDDSDRAYLAQVVSARTGLPPDEAQRRVTEVEGKARAAAKEAADKTAKAGAYFSFWTFMSLLFGGVAATLAGMLGGQLRDAEGRLALG